MILQALVFPGFLFLAVYSALLAFLDRKLYAKLQNRIGPPWYQPLADFLKLLGKETIIPEKANAKMFQGIPVFALASMATAFLCIPVFGKQAVFFDVSAIEGEIIFPDNPHTEVPAAKPWWKIW